MFERIHFLLAGRRERFNSSPLCSQEPAFSRCTRGKGNCGMAPLALESRFLSSPCAPPPTSSIPLLHSLLSTPFFLRSPPLPGVLRLGDLGNCGTTGLCLRQGYPSQDFAAPSLLHPELLPVAPLPQRLPGSEPEARPPLSVWGWQ